jgi:hypothetical protein
LNAVAVVAMAGAGDNCIREAAENVSILYSLYATILRVTTENITGRCPILSIEEEKGLSVRIFQLQGIGMPIAAKVARSIVYSYCEMISINFFNISEKRAGRKQL